MTVRKKEILSQRQRKKRKTVLKVEIKGKRRKEYYGYGKYVRMNFKKMFLSRKGKKDEKL